MEEAQEDSLNIGDNNDTVLEFDEIETVMSGQLIPGIPIETVVTGQLIPGIFFIILSIRWVFCLSEKYTFLDTLQSLH